MRRVRFSWSWCVTALFLLGVGASSLSRTTAPPTAAGPPVTKRTPPDDEPRDEAWAMSMEAAMTPLLAARIAEDYPDAKLLGVSCRSTRCLSEYDLPAARAQEIFVFMQLTMPHGPRSRPWLDRDDGRGRVYASFDGELGPTMRDGDDYRRWFDWSTGVVEERRGQLRLYRRLGWRWWR